MSDVCGLIWRAVAGPFRSRTALQAEVLVLRHQLNVLHRSSRKRVALSNVDRLVLVGLYRVAATVLDALKIVQPETVIRWHLRHLLNSYQPYYNEARTHLSLRKDTPMPREVQRVGRVLALPILGGLHHRYVRV
jgi:hypothetical protein